MALVDCEEGVAKRKSAEEGKVIVRILDELQEGLNANRWAKEFSEDDYEVWLFEKRKARVGDYDMWRAEQTWKRVGKS